MNHFLSDLFVHNQLLKNCLEFSTNKAKSMTDLSVKVYARNGYISHYPTKQYRSAHTTVAKPCARNLYGGTQCP